jgi:predicted TIM-barrel fold metal-dependent hydrolase
LNATLKIPKIIRGGFKCRPLIAISTNCFSAKLLELNFAENGFTQLRLERTVLDPYDKKIKLRCLFCDKPVGQHAGASMTFFSALHKTGIKAALKSLHRTNECHFIRKSIMPISQSWLDQISEKTIEPDLPICDPHHHLWNYPDSRYLLDELNADLRCGHNVRSTVFVECMSMYNHALKPELAPLGETEFVEKIAVESNDSNRDGFRAAAGIISHANLSLGGKVEEVLQAHQQASPERFRGIRHSASWDINEAVRNSHSNPPPQLYLDKTFRAGFACFAQQDLVFDAWLYHPQLLELSDLANAFPYQTIVLDHVGGPLGIGPYAKRRPAVFSQWRKDIQDLAKHENVCVKLGGLGMAINGFDWHKQTRPPTSKQLAAANRPYITHCIDVFGANRCMFESNFPVDKVSASYNTLWNSFKRITKDFSSYEKALLYHDNAVRVYKL